MGTSDPLGLLVDDPVSGKMFEVENAPLSFFDSFVEDYALPPLDPGPAPDHHAHHDHQQVPTPSQESKKRRTESNLIAQRKHRERKRALEEGMAEQIAMLEAQVAELKNAQPHRALEVEKAMLEEETLRQKETINRQMRELTMLRLDKEISEIEKSGSDDFVLDLDNPSNPPREAVSERVKAAYMEHARKLSELYGDSEPSNDSWARGAIESEALVCGELLLRFQKMNNVPLHHLLNILNQAIPIHSEYRYAEYSLVTTLSASQQQMHDLHFLGEKLTLQGNALLQSRQEKMEQLQLTHITDSATVANIIAQLKQNLATEQHLMHQTMSTILHHVLTPPQAAQLFVQAYRSQINTTPQGTPCLATLLRETRQLQE